MKRYLLAGLSSIAMMTGAHAADLLVLADPEQEIDVSFVESPIYVQLLGGATLGIDATFYLGGALDVADPTRVGYALAGTVGVNLGAGFSVEADVMRTFRNEVAAGDDTYATTSLMGNLKYTIPVTESATLYAAVGAGYIWVNNFDGPPVSLMFDFGGMGYQLIAGASYEFTDNLAGLAEVRYQNSFSNYELGGTATLNLPTVSVLAGLKLSF